MEGQLSAYPLAELIREIMAAELSGALRLQRERAKAAIYFADGKLVFAASNLRAHRLREVLKRGGFGEARMNDVPVKASDDDLAEELVQSGRLTRETLATILSKQVSDVLRAALLWTDGTWEFDARVSLASDVRVKVDVNRLLLECARHLPVDFVWSRFCETNGLTYQAVAGNDVANLLPAEASVLARASASVKLSDLTALAGESKEDYLRAIYALSLSGLLQRSSWPAALETQTSKRLYKRSPASLAGVEVVTRTVGEADDVERLFARLQTAQNYYETLDVARLASVEEIKNAYHSLARSYHPDRFHKSESALRARVDSAFAHIAQAYETLSNRSSRAAYDAKLTSKSSKSDTTRTTADEKKKATGEVKRDAAPDIERAESSFQQGLAALQKNQHDHAIRFFAEAAMLRPREARYRANYGHSLIGQTNARRVAESELQTAVSLEPNNASHRVMLAELYLALGLRRRAQGEVERALAVDPKDAAARALRSSLKNK